MGNSAISCEAFRVDLIAAQREGRLQRISADVNAPVYRLLGVQRYDGYVIKELPSWDAKGLFEELNEIYKQFQSSKLRSTDRLNMIPYLGSCELQDKTYLLSEEIKPTNPDGSPIRTDAERVFVHGSHPPTWQNYKRFPRIEIEQLARDLGTLLAMMHFEFHVGVRDLQMIYGRTLSHPRPSWFIFDMDLWHTWTRGVEAWLHQARSDIAGLPLPRTDITQFVEPAYLEAARLLDPKGKKRFEDTTVGKIYRAGEKRERMLNNEIIFDRRYWAKKMIERHQINRSPYIDANYRRTNYQRHQDELGNTFMNQADKHADPYQAFKKLNKDRKSAMQKRREDGRLRPAHADDMTYLVGPRAVSDLIVNAGDYPQPAGVGIGWVKAQKLLSSTIPSRWSRTQKHGKRRTPHRRKPSRVRHKLDLDT